MREEKNGNELLPPHARTLFIVNDVIYQGGETTSKDSTLEARAANSLSFRREKKMTDEYDPTLSAATATGIANRDIKSSQT